MRLIWCFICVYVFTYCCTFLLSHLPLFHQNKDIVLYIYIYLYRCNLFCCTDKWPQRLIVSYWLICHISNSFRTDMTRRNAFEWQGFSTALLWIQNIFNFIISWHRIYKMCTWTILIRNVKVTIYDKLFDIHCLSKLSMYVYKLRKIYWLFIKQYNNEYIYNYICIYILFILSTGQTTKMRLHLDFLVITFGIFVSFT